MSPEHLAFIAKLSKDLRKRGKSFEDFLEDVKLEKLVPINTPFGRKVSGSQRQRLQTVQEAGVKVTELNAVDVVFGRGNSIAKHPGNWLFRQAVGSNKAYYATLYRELKSLAASALVDCFSLVGTRFLELADDDTTANGEPIYQTVSRSRVVEKFCQGLREKKFAIRGLVDEVKAGACVPKAVSPAGRKTKKQGNDNDEWVPGNKLKMKKTLGAIKKASSRNVKSSSGKKDKKGKTKPAKKQKEIKIKTKGKTKDGKIKAKKKSSNPKPESAAHRDGLRTPSPKQASKIKANSSSVLTPSASVAKTPPSSVVTATSSSSPKTKKSEVAPCRPSASRHDEQNPWSQRYGGPHFYAYPHYPPYFHLPEHYTRGGSMPLDPRYNNHPNETNLPDSETSPPATMSPPPQTLGDASLYYSVYADPRIVSPMEPDNMPNATYWKKRIRLDNSKRNDKEILAAFMESYEDCKKYAHEMCKTHKETVVERFPVDDDAENLVRVLWPSKLRKLSVDKVSPMPVFHDSDEM